MFDYQNHFPDSSVAIIGMGCRLPGGANSVEDLWELLISDRDGLVPIPRVRWHGERFYSPEGASGRGKVLGGGFLDRDVTAFDCDYFGISAREASNMDPQQRLVLEVAVEAIENSGHARDGLRGARAGVFMGGFTADYAQLQFAGGDSGRELISSHSSTGLVMTMLSNRVSHALDLTGPSMTVDTACSSSLVAVDLACQALNRGDCDAALAGGVNLMLTPNFTIAASQGGMLSPTSQSRPFDTAANGYVRGEGAAVVVLKRLADAMADGDRIEGVILGSAVTQDGHTNGITVPSQDQQVRAMETALQRAGCDPEAIAYVEAHGTGTPVGDPIECEAIGRVYGRASGRNRAVAVSSVKANLGHLEATAGVTGLIKTLLVLKNGVVPPQHNLEDINPRIDTDSWMLSISPSSQQLVRDDQPLLGAVNSFGFGGTNAHVILSGPPQDDQVPATYRSKQGIHDVILLSARSKAALQETATRCADLLDQGHSIPTVAGALARRGAHHTAHRIALTATSPAAYSEQLRAYAAGEGAPSVLEGNNDVRPVGDIAFVYTGMGPQWWGMGRSLIQTHPVARAAMEEVDSFLQPLAGWSVIEELCKDELDSQMHRAKYSQPANFALQVALTKVLADLGIRPDAIVGHSAGEPAAAWAAGALSLEDAVTVIVHRARLQDTTSGQGRLAAVGMSEQAAAQLPWVAEGRLHVAAINDPGSIALVGDESVLDELGESLAGGSIFFAKVPGNVPYHSPKMDPLRGEFTDSTHAVTPRTPAVPIYSTVTGNKVLAAEHDATYWWNNVRHPVEFSSAMTHMVNDGYRTFIEIGPNPVLRNSIRAALGAASAEGAAIPTLSRKLPDPVALANTVGSLYVRGYDLSLDEYLPDDPMVKVPATAWNRRTDLWVEAEQNQANRLGREADSLLGAKVSGPQLQWRRKVDHSMPAYLADHVVGGVQLMPGAAWAALAMAAGREAYCVTSCAVSNLTFEQGFVFDPDNSTQLMTTLDRATAELHVYSSAADEGPWRRHAVAHIQPQPIGNTVEVNLEALDEEGSWDRATTYDEFRRMGFDYGPAFQLIERLQHSSKRVTAVIDTTTCLDHTAWEVAVDPSIVDAAFQLLLPLTDSWNPDKSVVLPVGVEKVVVHDGKAPLAGKLHGFAEIREYATDRISADAVLIDEAGAVILEVRGFTAEKLVAPTKTRQGTQWLHELTWEPADLAAPVAADSHIGFLTRSEVPSWLADGLRDRGVTCRTVAPEELSEPDKLADLTSLVDLRATELPEDQEPAELSMSTSLAVLSTVRTLIETDVRMPLTVLTRHGVIQGDDSDAGSLPGASLWGLVRTLRQESAALDARLIDIDDSVDARAHLVAELAAPNDEDQVVIREHGRLVGRVHPMPQPLPSVPVPLHAAGTWLVTGGLGALGTLFVEWLASRGVGTIVITSRRDLPPADEWATIEGPTGSTLRRLARVQESGVTIRVEQADATSRDDLAALIERITAAGLPPVTGVIHAAGIVNDKILGRMTDDELVSVMRPKVQGAWNLHQVLGDADHMIFFSSISSVLVTAGQGAYAAGNAFMDALANIRHRQGHKTQSWNWGPWETGMIADLGLQDSFARRGLDLIPEETGKQLADQMLGCATPQIAIVSADWRTLVDSYAVVPMLIQHLAGSEEHHEDEVDILQQIYAAGPEDRIPLLAVACAHIVATVLRADAAALPHRKPLNQQGLDSMIAIELRIRLEKTFGSAPPLVFLLQEATIATLAEHINGELGDGDTDELLDDLATELDEATLSALLDEVEVSKTNA